MFRKPEYPSNIEITRWSGAILASYALGEWGLCPSRYMWSHALVRGAWADYNNGDASATVLFRKRRRVDHCSTSVPSIVRARVI